MTEHLDAQDMVDAANMISWYINAEIANEKIIQKRP